MFARTGLQYVLHVHTDLSGFGYETGWKEDTHYKITNDESLEALQADVMAKYSIEQELEKLSLAKKARKERYRRKGKKSKANCV